MRSLKAPGANTRILGLAVLSPEHPPLVSGTSDLGFNRMPDYKEHLEGHLVPGQAVR